MAKKSKHGNKKTKPSHVKYVATGRTVVNKTRRILKNNGEAFLKKWKPAVARHHK